MKMGDSNEEIELASKPQTPKKKTLEGKTIGQYLLGKSIGEGTFGKVKLGTHVLTKEKVNLLFNESVRLL